MWHAYEYWYWFDGYWEVLRDGTFWAAMWRTVLFMVVAVGMEFLIGFGLAMLFLKQFPGRGVLTLFFLLPMMVVPAVSGFVFFMIFQVDGPLNQALSLLLGHQVTILWLEDPSLALWSAMVVDIWQWTPLMFLILLSGLVALPEDQMSQARILGANSWHQFRYLILPMMKPIILIAPHHPCDRGLQGLRRRLPPDAGWARGRLDDDLRLDVSRGDHQLSLGLRLRSRAHRPDSRHDRRRLRGASDRSGAGQHARGARDAAKRTTRPASIRSRRPERRPDGNGRACSRPPDDDGAATRRAAAIGVRLAAARLPLARDSLLRVALRLPALLDRDDGVQAAGRVEPARHDLLVAGKNGPGRTSRTSSGSREQEGIFATGRSRSAIPYIENSIIAATGGTLLALVVGVLAAYGIARFRAGGRMLPFQILQLRMFPPIAIIIPLLFMFVYLHLWDTLWGLVILYGAVTFPFVVWLMRSFFQEVPREISDAAIVDGCTHWGAFFKVVLPQVKGGLAATALFVFILNWSDFLIALVMTQDNARTAPVFLQALQSGSAGQEYGKQAALAVILILPPAIFGLAIQKYLVRGLTFGAIKR